MFFFIWKYERVTWNFRLAWGTRGLLEQSCALHILHCRFCKLWVPWFCYTFLVKLYQALNLGWTNLVRELTQGSNVKDIALNCALNSWELGEVKVCYYVIAEYALKCPLPDLSKCCFCVLQTVCGVSSASWSSCSDHFFLCDPLWLLRKTRLVYRNVRWINLDSCSDIFSAVLGPVSQDLNRSPCNLALVNSFQTRYLMWRLILLWSQDVYLQALTSKMLGSCNIVSTACHHAVCV